jgi:hypothetical protein
MSASGPLGCSLSADAGTGRQGPMIRFRSAIPIGIRIRRRRSAGLNTR